MNQAHLASPAPLRSPIARAGRFAAVLCVFGLAVNRGAAQAEPLPNKAPSTEEPAGSSAAQLSPPPPAYTAPAPAPAPAAAPVQRSAPSSDTARLSAPPAPSARATAAAAPPASTGRAAAGPRQPPPSKPVANDAPNVSDKGEEDESPMAWLSATIRVGYGHINSGKLNNPAYNATVRDKLTQLAGYAADGMLTQAELAALPASVRKKIPAGLDTTELAQFVERVTKGTQEGACTPIMPVCTTPQRSGAHVGLILHVGGDGFGWDAEPYLFISPAAFSVGLYTGPKFDFQLANPFYLGFGLGAKVAYVAADGWRYGADVYGRIPVHMTYYVAPNFALELEGAFGAGVSGYATEPKDYIITTAPEFKFGTARSWDITFGIRFP